MKKREKKYHTRQNGKKDIQNQITIEEEKNTFPDYPVYPPGDDIYNKGKEEEDLNPEDIAKIKGLNEKPGKRNEKDFSEDITGSDLDVPGSELDDEQEDVGSEDEENNYYSIGGDNHNDLDEDKGD